LNERYTELEGVTSQAGPWQEAIEERAMRLALVKGKAKPMVPVGPGGVNSTFELELEGVGHTVYKPRKGEIDCRRPITPGTFYLREAAAYRVDRRFGFELVPITVIRTIDGDIGSIQKWVELERYFITDYTRLDQARMAVLDYILANTDRHGINWRTQDSARPAAVDNGLCLPRDTSYPLRSKWVQRMVGKELPEEVQRAVLAVDIDDAVIVLEELGIESQAVDGFRARLDEVRSQSRIVGTAWGGPIIAV
jgi:phosphoinositide 3-/4-kinase-like protein